MNTITNLDTLQERLYQLSQKLGFIYSKSEWSDTIQNSLSENNLKSNEPVPAWMVQFIQQFIDGKETDYIKFERPIDDTNLERRWIGFLDSVVGGEWEFDGESESVAFDQIKMQGIIDHVGNAFYTVTY